MSANREHIPRSLLGKISPAWWGLAASKKTVYLLSIPFSIWSLFGPLGRNQDHNGIRYLLGPIVVPMFLAIYFTVFPVRPYRGMPFVRPGTRNIDISDPVTMRLVDILRSPAAKRMVWQAAAKISAVLLLSMVTLTILVRDSLSWYLWSPGMVPGLGGCIIGCSIAVATEYIDWGLKVWVNQCKSRLRGDSDVMNDSPSLRSESASG